MEMFDEIVQTEIKPDGTVEVNLINDSAKEMENAAAEFQQSWRRFRKIDPAMATSCARIGIEWWKAAEWLMIADNRMKDAFCGRDRSPQSIRLFHRWRLKLVVDGKNYRTDA
jgi:hypothetical protein